jgi:acyl carrier protein
MQITIDDVKKVIEEADVLGDIDNLLSDKDLTEQGIDSLDAVNIYLILEEKFDVKIPDEDLSQVKSIDAIINYVNNKLK